MIKSKKRRVLKLVRCLQMVQLLRGRYRNRSLPLVPVVLRSKNEGSEVQAQELSIFFCTPIAYRLRLNSTRDVVNTYTASVYTK